MKVFTVGPVACYPEVPEEMNHQMFSHRSEEYKRLQRETVELLQEFMETVESIKLHIYQIFLPIINEVALQWQS